MFAIYCTHQLSLNNSISYRPAPPKQKPVISRKPTKITQVRSCTLFLLYVNCIGWLQNFDCMTLLNFLECLVITVFISQDSEIWSLTCISIVSHHNGKACGVQMCWKELSVGFLQCKMFVCFSGMRMVCKIVDFWIHVYCLSWTKYVPMLCKMYKASL